MCCSLAYSCFSFDAYPRCCQGDDAMVLPWFWSVVAVCLLPCSRSVISCFSLAAVLNLGCWCCWAGPLWPLYDICPCRSSCPHPAVGHWATFTPLTGLLSTLLFLPLDSSIFLTKLSHRSSTLFFLLSFISTSFSFSREEIVLSASIFFCRFCSTDSASLCVMFAVSVPHYSFTASISISMLSCIVLKTDETLWPVLQIQSI